MLFLSVSFSCLLIVASMQDRHLSEQHQTAELLRNTTRHCYVRNTNIPDCGVIRTPTLDGKCNNKLQPLAGAAYAPLKRLLPPQFADYDVMTPRLATDGGELPNPRRISNILNENLTKTRSSRLNAMFVTFGQFLAHDLVLTPMITEVDGEKVNCSCSNPHPTCNNIQIPTGDPHYVTQRCIPLKGSQVICGHSPNENLNQISSYIDGDPLYGSDGEVLRQLRDQDSGDLRMNYQHHNGCPMLSQSGSLLTTRDVPHDFASKINCPAHLAPPGSTCFVSGEPRLNENIALTSLHLLFTREHNRISRRLGALNVNWNGDQIFRETKRIIVAVLQRITYGEFVPALLGPDFTKRFGLNLLNNGNYFGYDPTYDATISNEFATAAFRFGHTQVGAAYQRLAPNYTREFPSIETFKSLFQQDALVNGTLPSILRGLMTDSALEVSPSMVDDLRNRMFESKTQVGKDLLAINIFRGRLNGLSSYNEYRELCGLGRVDDWASLTYTIPQPIINKLRAVYSHVDDIDLLIGGLSESSLPGGAVGPTLGCIIGHQMRDVRKGDRYWFENPGVFTPEQLEEIRKVTLSSLLCDVIEGMETIAPHAMNLDHDSNSKIPCDVIQSINLDGWKINSNKQQDGDWTRWFPSDVTEPQIILQKLVTTSPDCVCSNAIDVQRERLPLSRPTAFKVRFLCPKGSIAFADFPNIKTGIDYYWTNWFDRDTPSANYNDDVETLEYLRSERPNEICPTPIYIQAQTKQQESALHQRNRGIL
uniref:peroxidase mlt-7-like n=1 Tax=Ciona intestinalis TaxID=7719 RepID=UPI0002B8D1CF|nr:peroxidase mlt-7-like [Ciona intestinalis]|eukprot:XP_002126579.2 peroxidase mlt-7-like [Ciona intestinalis]